MDFEQWWAAQLAALKRDLAEPIVTSATIKQWAERAWIAGRADYKAQSLTRICRPDTDGARDVKRRNPGDGQR